MKKQYLYLLTLVFTVQLVAQKTTTFSADDGIQITADVYPNATSDTFILLFHQAGWSRGEYLEIAPKLNAKGYACLAVDLRSGGKVNAIANLTHKAAVKKGKPTAFIDAIQDIDAAVKFVKQTYNPKKIILWGSSYSSALVLKYAAEHSEGIAATLSFAPGEYFGSKDYITSSVAALKTPVFITSAKSEHSNWKGIYEAIPAIKKYYYLPETKGNHGSRALWEKFDDNTGYWKAVSQFLTEI